MLRYNRTTGPGKEEEKEVEMGVSPTNLASGLAMIVVLPIIRKRFKVYQVFEGFNDNIQARGIHWFNTVFACLDIMP